MAGAAIVFDDADLKTAIGTIASVWAFHSGQICTAPTRVIAQRAVYDQVVGGLQQAAGRMKVGTRWSPTPSSALSSPTCSGAASKRCSGWASSRAPSSWPAATGPTARPAST